MLSDRFFLFHITLSLVFIQLGFWILFLRFNLLPAEVPLFYFEPWGIKQLAPPQNLWLLIGLPTIVLIINSLVSRFAYRQEKLLAQIFIVSTALFSFLSFFALVMILKRIAIL